VIKLERLPEPQKLAANKVQWLKALQAAIAKYGSYQAIPNPERNRLIEHYKDPEITKTLFQSSHDKCAYCECNPTEGGYIEIDHFKPKSLYHENVFDWDNLLPACGRCNRAKLDHDTVKEEIVNPYKLDPEEIFYFDGELIQAKQGVNFDMGLKTINVCKLNRATLTKPRLVVYRELQAFIAAMEKTLDQFTAAAVKEEKKALLADLYDSIAIIDHFKIPNNRYAGFCRYLLNHCDSYRKVKTLIAGTVHEQYH
jgi:uncharacterized protein (TIGR02646 family)